MHDDGRHCLQHQKDDEVQNKRPDGNDGMDVKRGRPSFQFSIFSFLFYGTLTF